MPSNAQPNVSRPHRCTENGRDNGSEWSKVPLLPDVTMGYSNGLKKSAKSPPRPATSKSFSTSGGNRLSSRVSAIPNLQPSLKMTVVLGNEQQLAKDRGLQRQACPALCQMCVYIYIQLDTVFYNFICNYIQIYIYIFIYNHLYNHIYNLI